MSSILLDIKNLNISFFTDNGEFRVVRDVSISIKESEVVGIIGESGCGKTMTALSILKLIPEPGEIKSGALMFRGENIVPLDESEMLKIRGEQISMIFQEPMTSLNPVFKIGDQIGEMFLYHTDLNKNKIKEKVIELLYNVQIPRPEEVYNYYPHQLSGGMRQRVMIAIAIALNPSLIIADEPTTALDVTVQAEILKLLKNLKDKYNVSILFITHDFGVVSEIADRIYVMYAGEIIETASRNEIFNNPLHPYTKALFEAIPGYKGNFDELKSISGNVPELSNIPDRCMFYDRCRVKSGKCLNKIILEEKKKHHLSRCVL